MSKSKPQSGDEQARAPLPGQRSSLDGDDQTPEAHDETRILDEIFRDNGDSPADIPAPPANVPTNGDQTSRPNDDETVGQITHRLFDSGFRPVVIYPRGFPRKSGPATGKEPFGKDWGTKPLDHEILKRDVNYFRGQHAQPGVGLCLGPDRGPGGRWLIDVEGDGPEAEDSWRQLLGGVDIQTMGWDSTRGRHRLLCCDGERLKLIATNLKPFQVKDEAKQPGVYHIPQFPGLELRIGGFKPNGALKQLQSVVPPTPGTDGKPRKWNGITTVADAPEALYLTLSSLASPSPNGDHRIDSATVKRAHQSYAAAALKAEVEKVATAKEGHRNQQLNDSAFALGTLIGAGALDEETAREALHEAATRPRPDGSDGLDDSASAETITSGLEAGKLEPRDLSHIGGDDDAFESEPITDLGIMLKFKKSGGTGLGTVTARIKDEVTHSDRINIQKNDAREKFAAKLAGICPGAKEEDIEAALLKLAAKVVNREEKAKDDKEDAGETHAEILLRLAGAAEFFHIPDGTVYASYPVKKHRETQAVRSKIFRRWLIYQFYHEQETAPSRDAIAQALDVLEAQAHYDGDAVPIFTRIAGHDDAIYIDLCDSEWRVIKVTTTGWSVIAAEAAPVHFRRPKGLKPLPVPVSGGTIDELREHINVPDDGEWKLVVAFLTAAMRPTGPYPILDLGGEAGVAKSTITMVIRSLCDPYEAVLRRQPREERDLFITAVNSWCPTFNNLSGLPVWFSDALCAISTGGGYACRELYSDDGEVFFNVCRPIILNGVEGCVTRDDALSRAIRLVLSPIPADKRIPENKFWDRFHAAAPRMLGAVLDALSGGMRELPSIEPPELPRMADFAAWGLALGRALGWGDRDFLDAYEVNRGDAAETVLDASLVGVAIQNLVAQKGEWEGTMGELLTELTANQVSEQTARAKEWPRTPRKLSGALRRIVPALRHEGIEVSFPDPRIHHDRKLKITKIPKPTKAETETQDQPPQEPPPQAPNTQNIPRSSEGGNNVPNVPYVLFDSQNLSPEGDSKGHIGGHIVNETCPNVPYAASPESRGIVTGHIGHIGDSSPPNVPSNVPQPNPSHTNDLEPLGHTGHIGHIFSPPEGEEERTQNTPDARAANDLAWWQKKVQRWVPSRQKKWHDLTHQWKEARTFPEADIGYRAYVYLEHELHQFIWKADVKNHHKKQKELRAKNPDHVIQPYPDFYSQACGVRVIIGPGELEAPSPLEALRRGFDADPYRVLGTVTIKKGREIVHTNLEGWHTVLALPPEFTEWAAAYEAGNRCPAFFDSVLRPWDPPVPETLDECFEFYAKKYVWCQWEFFTALQDGGELQGKSLQELILLAPPVAAPEVSTQQLSGKPISTLKDPRTWIVVNGVRSPVEYKGPIQGKLRPAFKCFGGKYPIASWIASFILPFKYDRYIEPFAGGLSVLLTLPPATEEFVIDRDPEVLNLYGILTRRTDDLITAIEPIPYDFETFDRYRASDPQDELERAIRFLVVNHFSSNGLGRHYAKASRLRGKRHPDGPIMNDASAWRSIKEELREIADRLRNVVFYDPANLPNPGVALLIYEGRSAPDRKVLSYADPTYLLRTRTAKNAYKYNLTDDDHVELLTTALDLVTTGTKFFISGYRSEMYRDLLESAGWVRHEREVPNHAGHGKTKQRRLECLWESPSDVDKPTS
jgi:site-specific DNA-adenine methylase